MGISYGRLKVMRLDDKTIKLAYYSQLFINALWPIIFFTLKWRLVAFIWILLLDGAIINMLYQFFKKDKVSAYLQIPYIIWSLFASYLNLAIYLLN